MITVQLSDKNVTVEFPDGTSPEIMRSAIRKKFYGGVLSIEEATKQYSKLHPEVSEQGVTEPTIDIFHPSKITAGETIATLVNPAEVVTQAGAGAWRAIRMGQPIAKEAIDWALMGVPSLARGVKEGGKRFIKALTEKEPEKAKAIVSGLTKEEIDKIVPPFTKVEKEKIASEIKLVTGEKPTTTDIKIIEQEAKVAKIEGEINVTSKETPEIIERLGEFHGTSSEINGLQEYTYNPFNLYGHGFYTTDKYSVAIGYTKKGGGKTPTVYETKWLGKTRPKLIDLEKPLDGKSLSVFENQKEFNPYLPDNIRGRPARQIYQEMRENMASEGITAEEAESLMTELNTQLLDAGYDGLSHIGGRYPVRPGKPEHQVKIYFEPQKLEIKKVLGQEAKLEGMKPKVEPEFMQSIEAQVKGGVGLEGSQLPKYAEGSAINLERLNTTDEVKNLINTIAKEQEANIGKRKVSWEETRKQAEALGWDVDAVKKAWGKSKAFSAAEIEATRQVNINAVTTLRETLSNLPYERANITPEMRAKVLDAIDTIKVTSQAASESGRALNIHKKVLSREPGFGQTKQLHKIIDAVSGKRSKRTDDVIDALRGLDLTNPSEVNQKVYDLTKTKWQKLSDSAYELWINGLLSNPLTHIVNTTSNALTLTAQYPERVLASVVEKGRSKMGVFGGKEQELFVTENARSAFSVIKGLHDATKRFFDAMKTGQAAGTKLEYRPSALPESVRRWLPGRGLQAEDEFFKSFIQSSELNRLAVREGRKLGLRGDALKAKVTDLLKSPTEDMLEEAAKRAKYLTFQADLGKVGQWVMSGRDRVPGLKYFIPFVRTPLNIAKYGLERTPLNIARIGYKVSKGELRGGEFSEEVAKTLMGSMIGATAYLMAEEGIFTGGGPKNYNERMELMRTGWLPYSMKLGDTYYSMARLEPIASIMGLAADMKELKDNMSEDEKMAVGMAIAASITKNFTSKTFTQGFSQIMDAVSDPGQYAEKMIRNLAGTVIPAVSGGVARAIDPEIKDARTIIDTIKSRLPVVSESVQARLTPWGEPIVRGGSVLSRFLSPVQVSESKGHPIDKELTRLKLNLGMPTKKIKGKELTDDQYRALVSLGGQRSMQKLNQLIQTDYYKKLTDEQKQKLISNIVNKNRDYARQVIERGM